MWRLRADKRAVPNTPLRTETLDRLEGAGHRPADRRRRCPLPPGYSHPRRRVGGEPGSSRLSHSELSVVDGSRPPAVADGARPRGRRHRGRDRFRRLRPALTISSSSRSSPPAAAACHASPDARRCASVPAGVANTAGTLFAAHRQPGRFLLAPKPPRMPARVGRHLAANLYRAAAIPNLSVMEHWAGTTRLGTAIAPDHDTPVDGPRTVTNARPRHHRQRRGGSAQTPAGRLSPVERAAP